jgi:hypothetical protein
MNRWFYINAVSNGARNVRFSTAVQSRTQAGARAIFAARHPGASILSIEL